MRRRIGLLLLAGSISSFLHERSGAAVLALTVLPAAAQAIAVDKDITKEIFVKKVK